MTIKISKRVKSSFTLSAILLSSGMPFATTIMPANALSKSEVNHASILSSTPRKSITIAQVQNVTFPVQGTRENKVVRRGYMKTSFDLDSNGNLNATTKTWTSRKTSGFTGGVLIAFTDKSGNAIWSTDQQRYGVDGKWIGKSSRTENWQAKVPPEILNRIGGYAIVQEHTPRGRVLDWIGSPQAQNIIKNLTVLF